MDTKSRIILRAHELFSARGYNGISLNDVIKSCRVSKGGFFHYFASKDHLFKSVLKLHEDRLRESRGDIQVYTPCIRVLIKWLLGLDNYIDLSMKEACLALLQREVEESDISYEELGHIVLYKYYTKSKNIKRNNNTKRICVNKDEVDNMVIDSSEEDVDTEPTFIAD